MMISWIACALLALLLATDLSRKGVRIPLAAILSLLALAPLALLSGPGLALVCLGAYALGTRLSRMAQGRDDRARLPAALAAGGLALSGPFGAVGASAAIAIHALTDTTRPRPEALVIGAVLLFIPLTVLLTMMAASFVETGDLWSIEAGGGLFLRGPLRPLDTQALVLGAPIALPLLLLLFPARRALAAAPLAIAAGGLVASLLFMTPAPLLPFFIAAALAASVEQAPPRRAAYATLLATALATFAFMGIADKNAAIPLADSWRLASAASQTPLGWGAPHATPGLPLPRIARQQGHYILLGPAP